MCVILVCPEEVRPKPEVLYACHEANPHGAGLAWREGGRVRWQKNLTTGEVVTLLKKLEGEVVIHFRWASVGGVDARLCHPFPVTPKANLSLSGMAESVLFHNGTWSGYADALERLGEERELPGAPMSDTRAAALLVHAAGPEVLDKLPGRWVWMNAAETRLSGAWETWRGMQVSNTHFVPRLRAAQARRAAKTTPSLPLHQSCLFAC